MNAALISPQKCCNFAPNGATTVQPGATPQERNQKIRQAPNGAAQVHDRTTNEIIITTCFALSGLNHSNGSPSQGVALG